MTNTEIAVLRFGGRRLARQLASLPCRDVTAAADVDAAVEGVRRVVVVGDDADLATVLTRLMRLERLDVEVAHVPGRLGARRATTAAAQRVPLIRDETGTVLVGAAYWLPPGDSRVVRGEAVVDDAVLFRYIATTVADLPVLDDVAALRWTGPAPSFTAMCERLDAVNLVDRAARAAARV